MIPPPLRFVKRKVPIDSGGRNGVLFLNPGSAGPRRFGLPVSIALVHIEGTSVEAELVTLET